VPQTRFVGRTAELAELRQLLSQNSPPRLLTLTGPGGCGKTRLALELTAEVLTEAPGGEKWWVELAGVADASLVPQTVADVLGLREAPPQPLLESIAAFVGDRAALLVLDNCEHLITACAELSASLLDACSQLRILATSREPLGLRPELVWSVPPLSLPAPGRQATPEAAAASDAVQLFVERACLDLPAFRVTEENAAAVAEVCQQLEGLPLAIELAAARVALLRVEQIVTRLRDRLRLLTGGSPAAAPRQQTLRATLDWSHDLLTEPERVLFRRLSVFAGGWSLEAAEAVGAETDSEAGEVLERLAQLVRKSLVVVEREPGREARFRLLDTVREYSGERLREARERERSGDRHLDYCVRLAKASHAHLGFFLADAEATIWTARLRPELDNLRAALEWSAQDSARCEAGLRMMSALHWFWFTRGHFTEARHWLDRLLELGHAAAPGLRARALVTAGWLACWQGAFAAARAPLEAGLRLAREQDDRWSTAFSLHALGWAAAALGDGARGRQLTEECLGIARRLGDLWLIGFSLHFLGIGAAFQGDFPAARAHFDECIALMRQTGGNASGLAFSLFHLGRMDRLEGQHARAAEHYQEALRLFQALGDPRGVAYALAGLGSLGVARGDAALAARLFGAVATLRATVGSFLEAPLQVEHDRDVAAARAALPGEVFAAAWAEGYAAGPGVAIETQAPAAAMAVEPAVRPAAELRLLGFGPAQVYRGDTLLRAADWTFAKPKQLLFFLASHAEQTREQIGLVFWPEATPAQVRTGLRSALYRLRQALGRPDWVLFQDERYAFNRGLGYWYDVEAFEAGLAEAGRLLSAAPERAMESWQSAIALYRGDFLEDFPDDDWVLARREALRRQQLQALLSLGRLLLAAGRTAEAAETYRQAITRDGYLEAAYRGLMRCYARQGEPGRALRHYQSLRALLADELGAAPSPETAELHDRLRRGELI
jgi:non-specific serine/threonine protein kinase